ncbi:shikimate dehydrogenase [Listeria valentina]|uniref:shikimate dehydrogenase n=1 Tax=Listeria valentina TaxID=2705293 RepID=UPI001431CA4D|nr:shikimate dehydrogenase [Listeria valentina]
MKHFAVIGNPIVHSLSPIMHQAAIQDLQLDAIYTRKKLSKELFDQEITDLLLSDLDGFNVTIPFKERILPYLDEVDSFAKKCGAVNTVVRRQNKWVGYNTDGRGFLEGLTEKRPLQDSDRVLIIGAGGASKGIYLALKESYNGEVTVANRTLSKAEEMLEPRSKDRAITLTEAANKLSQFTIIIQTTAVGLNAENSDLPLALDLLSSGTLVSDIIYNPFETPFLQEAKKRGAITQNGLAMFVNQGALAFKLWTEENPDRAVMRQAVLDSFEEE